MRLHEALLRYASDGRLPMHMPGHKRKPSGFPDPYTFDITEIDGFDDLNDPKGMYREMEAGFERLYGADSAFVTVNGSTGGNLAMIAAALHTGDHVLVASNCHRSVWNALSLKDVVPVVTEIPENTDGFPGAVDPADILEKLDADPKIRAVVLTSPTYEGVESDLEEIARICHSHGAALLADAAHGAHCVLRDDRGKSFVRNPIRCGADAAVVSLHKTLPALTQTALLLYRENPYFTGDSIAEKLRIFQTSSPSYVLGASASLCLTFLEEQGDAAGAALGRNLRQFYRETSAHLKVLHLFPPECHDPGKIVVLTDRSGKSGPEVAELLRHRFRIEPEMAVGNEVLLMATVADDAESLEKVQKTLYTIDRSLSEAAGEELNRNSRAIHSTEGRPAGAAGAEESRPDRSICTDGTKAGRKFLLTPYQAAELPAELLGPLEAAEEGTAAASTVAVYPPGVPILVPGQAVTAQAAEGILDAARVGLTVNGLQNGRIRVLRPDNV